ncbi:VOC family protein [Pseudarthrobacter sp. S9]|uniref:VOC family protein n=1 Tax=Pseudarthrobacter sp. S9 TaxID=3418421 RepID=UPI003D01FF8C
MLGETNVHTTLPAIDLARAKQWYQEKLGLTPAEEPSGGLRYEAGGGSGFIVYLTPNPNRGGHTQMGFRVTDLRAEMTALRGAGVVFEEYDFPGFKTVDGVADVNGRPAAFFKDSEGNILGLVEYA